VAQGSHNRLALRWAWRNRGPFDGKPAPLEVDVVQLVPVDEPSSRDVADLSVVLPAIPQPAQHLNVIGGLSEILVDLLLHGRIIDRTGRQARQRAAPEVSRHVVTCRDLNSNAGSAGADVVERGDRLRHVKRLGLGDSRCWHEPNPPSTRGDSGGDEHRVQPATNPIGPIVGVKVNVGLRAQRVFNRHEVQQAAFGLGNQISPVARIEQLGRRASASRHAAGCQPAPSNATARWRGSRRIRHKRPSLPNGYDLGTGAAATGVASYH